MWLNSLVLNSSLHHISFVICGDKLMEEVGIHKIYWMDIANISSKYSSYNMHNASVRSKVNICSVNVLFKFQETEIVMLWTPYYRLSLTNHYILDKLTSTIF